MAPPTRAQIESLTPQPTYRITVYNSATLSFQEIADNDVIEISGVNETVNERDNALLSGDGVITTAQFSVATNANIPTNWKRARVFIYLSFSGADFVPAFFGYIVKKTRANNVLTYTCEGILQTVISDLKLFTPVQYRRPAASITTASSVENPDSGSYTGGIINEIFWRAGGRPLAQSGTYTTAQWYYECDNSIFYPEWSWLSGENLLDELYRIARATGGQIYQTNSNIVRYVQPHRFSSGSGFIINDSYFGNYSEEESTNNQSSAVRVSYTSRYQQSLQSVYTDDNPKIIYESSSQTFEAIVDVPVFIWDTPLTSSGIITTSGIIVAYGPSNLPETPNLVINELDAQRVRYTITNNRLYPIIVTKIDFWGSPIAVNETQTYLYGSGTPEKVVEDNPYIQTESMAKQLARFVYEYNSTLRPIITLTDCIYDPDRYVGETVTLISSLMGVSGLFRIVSVSHDLGGIKSDLKLVSLSGLRVKNDFFVIGTSYSSGNTRRVSY